MTQQHSPNQNTLATFFASLPINKRDRNNLKWYETQLQKYFKKQAKKHKKHLKSHYKKLEETYNIAELNVFLMITMKLPGHVFETKEARTRFEQDIKQLHEKYLKRTFKHITQIIHHDLEFNDTTSIIQRELPEHQKHNKKQAQIIKSTLQNDVHDIYMKSITMLWDLPGTQIDRIILAQTIIDKGIKVIDTLYQTHLYQSLQKQGKDHKEIIQILTQINRILTEIAFKHELNKDTITQSLKEPSIQEKLQACGINATTCQDYIMEFYENNFMDLLESSIGDLADELAFLGLSSVLLPELKKYALLPDIETHIHRILEAVQTHLNTITQGVSKHEKKRLEEFIGIYVGKILGFREHLWFLRKLLDRVSQLETELQEEADQLNDEELPEIYMNIINEEDLTTLQERTFQIEKYIDLHANQIRTLSYQLTKIPVNKTHKTEINSTQPPQFYQDIAELYYKIDALRMFLQFWNDLPYFTTVLAGVAQETGQSTKKIKESPFAIEAQNLYKRYVTNETTVYALRGINLEIKPGEYVAIIGPSGSGKTTLLNVLSGLDKPDRGEIFIDGQNVPLMTEKELVKFRRNTIAFIFQDFLLLPEYNALENVELPGLYADTPNSRDIAKQLLDQVGILQYHTHLPTELSGGQQQRVAVARAFINNPKVLFADEPTGSLDHETGNTIMELIEQWNKNGTTVLVVTHDLEIAKRAQRVFIMFDGKIKKEVDPQTTDLKKEMENILNTT